MFCLLGAGEEMLRGHVTMILSAIMHGMKKTMVSSNRVSIKGHEVKIGVVDVLEGVTLVCSVIFLKIVYFSHCTRPETFICAVM